MAALLKTESRTIGSATYKVRVLTVSEGRPILVLLTKLLGPSLGTLLSSSKEPGEGVLGASNEAVGWAIRDLAERLSDADLAKLCEVFGAATEIEVGGKTLPLGKETQELHFAGKYGEMMRWIGFCVELNFADFLDGVLGIAGLQRQAAVPTAA